MRALTQPSLRLLVTTAALLGATWLAPERANAQDVDHEVEDSGADDDADVAEDVEDQAAGAEAGAEAGTEPQTATVPVTESGAGPEPGAGSEPGAGPEPGAGHEPGAAPEVHEDVHEHEDSGEDSGEELPRGTFVAGRFSFRPMVEVRERFETRIDPYTAAGTGDNAYFVASRARLGLDVGFESLRLLVQVADARSFGQFAAGTDDGGTTGLHQGFLELALGEGRWLRLGRQEINLGHQRLVGALNWSTAGRSFDALRVHLGFGPSSLDLIGAMARWVRRVTETDDTVDPPEERSTLSTGDELVALYFAWAALEAVRLDAYVLYRHDGATEGDVERERDIAAPGLRLHGAPAAGLTYEVEGVIQAGRAGGRRHLAFGAALEVAYVVQVPIRPGFALGGSYGSGGAPGDSITELDNFYPTNHGFYGIADLFGWRNLLHGYFRISSAPTAAPITVSLNNHVFGLASPGDRWSSAGGATLGADSANRDRFLGYELDVDVGWRPRDWFAVSLGYALFIPATAASNLGHDRPTHWAYVMLGSVLP